MKQITDIISETSFGESRVGFFSDDKLIECWIENNKSPTKITEIHLAKVIQIVKPINRIFYKLYNETEVSSRCFNNFPEIGTLEIITIASETKEDKPPHAQRGFYLNGKFAIVVNKDNFIGLSRNIVEESERERLDRIANEAGIKKAGVIIRSAAENIPEDELRKDFEELFNLWQSIKNNNGKKQPIKIFDGLSLENQATNLLPKSKVIKDNNSVEFNKRNGVEQLTEAHSSTFKIKNGGILTFEKTKAITSIDIDSSKRDLNSGGLNKLTEDGLALALELIRLRNTSGLILIDLPRISKKDFSERFNQALSWSSSMFRQMKVLGGTKGGVFEIICNHERTQLDESNDGLSQFIALESLRKLSQSKTNHTKLFVSNQLMEILNINFKTELNKVKEINNGIEILIDNNLDNDNYYLNK